MALIWAETWDGVSAGTLPSGWTLHTTGLTTITSAYSPDTLTPFSSPNMVGATGFSGNWETLTWDMPDTAAGDATVTGEIATGTALDSINAIMARSASSAIDYSTGTFYEAQVDFSGGAVSLNAYVAGSLTTLGTVSATLAANAWYQLSLTCDGTLIYMLLERRSDGKYLNSSGVWQTGGVPCIQVTDSSVSGAGYAGLGAFLNHGSHATYFDDWSFSQPDAPFPATPYWPYPSKPLWAAYTAYSSQQYVTPTTAPVLPTTAAAVWPNQAPGPRRATADVYSVVVQPQMADAVLPPGNLLYQDRISYPGMTGRASVQTYIVVCPGPGNVTPPVINPGIFPTYPDAAPGPRRAVVTAYAGLFSQRAQGDKAEPGGVPVFPSVARGPARAANDAYRGLYSARMPDGATSSHIVAPDAAPGPRRAATYTIVVTQEVPDRLEPPASPTWPAVAPGPRRAAPSAYQAWQGSPFESPVPRETGSVVFPDLAPGPRRAAPSAYAGLLSRPVIADGHLPAQPQFPGVAPGPRRAATYTIVVNPALPDHPQPSGAASWPALAPTAKRATPESYRGLYSAPAQPSPRPVGTVHASLPQRAALRASATAYAGLFSQPAQPDTHMPAGAVVFPARADGPRRAQPSAYDHPNRPALPQTFTLSVAADVKLQAFAGWGAVYILGVSSGVNLQPSLPGNAGGSSRYRLGDLVNVAFAPTIMPASAPTLVITDDNGGQVASIPLWTWDGVTFQTNVLLDLRFPVGTFVCTCYFTEATGAGQLLAQQFSVVAGGDPGSNVIATYVHEGATRRILVAQLRSGSLVSGADPYLES